MFEDLTKELVPVGFHSGVTLADTKPLVFAWVLKSEDQLFTHPVGVCCVHLEPTQYYQFVYKYVFAFEVEGPQNRLLQTAT